MTLSCETKTCDEIQYINWSYRSTSTLIPTQLKTIYYNEFDKKISITPEYFYYNVNN